MTDNELEAELANLLQSDSEVEDINESITPKNLENNTQKVGSNDQISHIPQPNLEKDRKSTRLNSSHTATK